MELEGSCSFRVFTAAQSHDVGQEWESHVHRTFNLLGKAEKKGRLHRARFGWGGGVTALLQLTAHAQSLSVVSLFVVLYKTVSQGVT